MAQQFSMEWARDILNKGMAKAQSIVEDPAQVEELLAKLQEKMNGLPDTVSAAFTNVPVMAAMVKSYITREYTDVSPKVIVSLVGAFLYLVKQKDIIPDDIPVVGFADDLVIATFVMAINEPELRAFSEWRDARAAAAAEDVQSVEPVEIIDVPIAEA
ncbi:YkvA family protein [Slackia heliotrinireducens]|uniref:Uncharacterized conserved protein n=1 Tax=Slackia heliotrinireducens (strain ATCC 29202 / DSM 20476 / NCTC 11029 / RHS 1) TaxID=471855 RepID=C7N874_SLAHD|nr:YkvA family protein [Slackia heliotrinireducens]ACV23109.1 uncharacterized conserved protein [Slackia heliotrinireducens DSM 20476]VEH02113.1 Uncharacterized conserved protein [Slackia heliotrinireducens]